MSSLAISMNKEISETLYFELICKHRESESGSLEKKKQQHNI